MGEHHYEELCGSEKQNDAIDPDNAYGAVNLFPGIVVGHTLGQSLYLHVASARGINIIA